MKKLLIFAAMAAMLTACSSNDELNMSEGNKADGSITFDVYTQRAHTRAGINGTVSTTSLQEGDHAEAGFGVFGYNTDNDFYSPQKSVINFMYNQQVVYDNGVWNYEPVKYWPNEYGKDAKSEDTDRLSFFAYAPYVEVNPNSGVPTFADFNSAFGGKAYADADEAAEFFEQLLGNDDDYGAYVLKKSAAINDLERKYLNLLEQWEDAVVAGDMEKADELKAQMDQIIDVDYPAAEEAYEQQMLADLQKEYKTLMQGRNITQLTRSTDTGDPIVKYVVDTRPSTSVDLLWGVAAADNNYSGMASGETVNGGNCYVNLSKQDNVENKVKWNFKHALARLNVQICTDVDVATPSGEGENNYSVRDLGTNQLGIGTTKVYVRSVDMTGFATQGALNLHSDEASSIDKAQPNWMAYDGASVLLPGTVTFYDGLIDGQEGTNYNIANGETQQGLNACIIEGKPSIEFMKKYNFDPSLLNIKGVSWILKPSGVPVKPVNLFAGAADADDAIFVIPTGDQMNMTITYEVQTYDEDLVTKLSDNKSRGSRVKNVITQPLVDASGAPVKMEAGKSYTIRLYLGLESVKFDVVVDDEWPENEGSIAAPDNNTDDGGEGGETTYDTNLNTTTQYTIQYTGSTTVFGPLNVTDGGDYWIYQYEVSPGTLGHHFRVKKDGAYTGTALDYEMKAIESDDNSWEGGWSDQVTFTPVSSAKSALEIIQSALGYSYTDYTYNGTFGTPSVDGSDDNVILPYTKPDPFGNGSGMMNDLARILGALYRANSGDITKLTWNAKEFTWDEETDPSNLKGSNWRNAEGTLVSQITSAYQANPTMTQITFSTNLGYNYTIMMQ